MHAHQLRAAIEAAPRDRLSALAAAVWEAFAGGLVTEAEAGELSEFAAGRGRARGAAQPAAGGLQPLAAALPRRVGSRPRTGASMERRRRWAASGRLPPALAVRFTLAEQAVLALIAAETIRRGDCRLAVGHLAAIAGVSETTVRNAVRQARVLGLLSVEERRVTGFRNLPNIVRIVSAEWTSWLRLRGGSAPPGGRVQISQGHAQGSSTSRRSRQAEPPGRARREDEAGSDKASSEIAAREIS